MYEPFLGVNPWTALFVLLNTLTIFFVGRKYLYGPVTAIITQRQQEIDSLYADARRTRQQADNLRDEYSRKLTDARNTADRLVQEAVARGKSREEEILRQAKNDAAAILDRAAGDIALNKRKVLGEAKDEIAGLSLVIAGKVLEREVSSRDHVALIDRFIDELGDAG